MPEIPSQETYYEDEPIDLFELWNVLWKEKVLIIGITLVFAIGSVIYALAQTDIYRSEALLVPAEASQPTNPLLSQLGAAAGLIGIGAADNLSSQVTTAIATMQSREFLRQFIEKHNIKPSLFAGTWDGNATSGAVDESIYSVENDSWANGEPSDQDAVAVLRNVLSVSNDQSSGLVTVAIEWNDPQLARDWVSWLVDDVNELIKQQDLIEATSAIEYLQDQLQTTQLVDMQRAFYQLIESQTRIVMLADVRDDYVFRIVDPAIVPEGKIRPSRTAILIVGTLLGGMFSVLFVLFLNAYRSRKVLEAK